MAQPNRPLDVVYDTTMALSSMKDHFREASRATGFKVTPQPIFTNFFSELSHHPARQAAIKPAIRLPPHINPYARPPQPESRVARTLRSMTRQVEGAPNLLYYTRPLMAHDTDSVGPVKLHQDVRPVAQPIDASAAAKQGRPDPSAFAPEGHRTVGTQSAFRESEMQTTPWEPDYVLPENPAPKQRALMEKHHSDVPEILYLQHLHFGEGLPAGAQEIMQVKKLCEKRAFEASLPPISDAARLPERQRMLEEWETKEWAEREQEIEGLQEERLAIMEAALERREAAQDEGREARLETMRETRMQTKSQSFAAIQRRRMRTMRQLTSLREKSVPKGTRPSIIDEYADYGSQIYAPVQRQGRFPETQPRGKEIDPSPFEPASLRQLDDLHETLGPSRLHATVKVPPSRESLTMTARQRRLNASARDVEYIADLLEGSKSAGGRGFGACWPAPLQSGGPKGTGTGKRKAGRAMQRPGTPEAPREAPDAHLHRAATVLQKLLRGRAAQNQMLAMREQQLELVRELRVADAMASGAEAESLQQRHERLRAVDAQLGQAVAELLQTLAGGDGPERVQRLREAHLAMRRQALADLGAGHRDAAALDIQQAVRAFVDRRRAYQRRAMETQSHEGALQRQLERLRASMEQEVSSVSEEEAQMPESAMRREAPGLEGSASSAAAAAPQARDGSGPEMASPVPTSRPLTGQVLGRNIGTAASKGHAVEQLLLDLVSDIAGVPSRPPTAGFLSGRGASPLPVATPTTQDTDAILYGLLRDAAHIPSWHPVGTALERLAGMPQSGDVRELVDELKRSLELMPEDPNADAALAEILWEVAQGGPASRELTLEEMDAAARVVLGQMPMVDRAQRLAGLQRRGLGILGCILGGSAGGSEPAMQPVETEGGAQILTISHGEEGGPAEVAADVSLGDVGMGPPRAASEADSATVAEAVNDVLADALAELDEHGG